MSWQISIIINFVFAVSNNLWNRIYAQRTKLPSKVPPALSYLMGVMPLGILVGLFSRNIHVDWNSKTILLLITEGAFIGLFNWLAFIAWKTVNVAQFQTVFQLYAITSTLLGWVLLDERLKSIQIVGGVMLIVGALIAANSGDKYRLRLNFSKGVVLTASAAVCLGIGLVAEKAALNQMSLGAYFIFGYAAQTIALLVIAQKDLQKLRWRKISSYDLCVTLLLGVLSACVGFFYIYAIKKADNIGLVTMISTFQLPLSVVAGYLILKERENVIKMSLATAVALLGLILMSR